MPEYGEHCRTEAEAERFLQRAVATVHLAGGTVKIARLVYSPDRPDLYPFEQDKYRTTAWYVDCEYPCTQQEFGAMLSKAWRDLKPVPPSPDEKLAAAFKEWQENQMTTLVKLHNGTVLRDRRDMDSITDAMNLATGGVLVEPPSEDEGPLVDRWFIPSSVKSLSSEWK